MKNGKMAEAIAFTSPHLSNVAFERRFKVLFGFLFIKTVFNSTKQENNEEEKQISGFFLNTDNTKNTKFEEQELFSNNFKTVIHNNFRYGLLTPVSAFRHCH